MSKYRWADANDGTRLYDIGILPDGTLHNPRGYADDLVRRTVEAADEYLKARRSKAAKKAAATRLRRKELRVQKVVQCVLEQKPVGPRSSCCICGRGLGDSESIQRGIGSECWQDVLKRVTQLCAAQVA